MSAQRLEAISGLVAINSLMAMCGGIIAALVIGDNDPGFVHNGALAGLVAICAGSDVVHPLGAFIIGGAAGVIFVQMFQISTNKWQIDDVLGVWAPHGLCGLWARCARRHGGVTFASQLVGSIAGSVFGLAVGLAVYGVLRATIGIRLSAEAERRGADLAIHKIRANPEEDVRMVVG